MSKKGNSENLLMKAVPDKFERMQLETFEIGRESEHSIQRNHDRLLELLSQNYDDYWILKTIWIHYVNENVVKVSIKYLRRIAEIVPDIPDEKHFVKVQLRQDTYHNSAINHLESTDDECQD